MAHFGVTTGLRPSALVVAALVAASGCGDDSPIEGWSASVPAPLVEELEPTAATTRDTDERNRVRPSPSSDSTAASSTAPEPTTTAASPTAEPTTNTTTTAAPTTAPATSTTMPPQTTRQVLVIGDSTAAAMLWTGGEAALRGADFTLDLESCRRLVERSCNSPEGYTPSTALEALSIRDGQDHDTLIMATGYNDMDRDFNGAFDQIYAEARSQGIGTILWVTYREDVGFQLPTGSSSAYAEMNESLRLRVLSGSYPELELLDWWGYTREAPRWLENDGVHVRRAGAFGMADFISRRLAAMDGRACPVPWKLLTVPADPCPLPMDELERTGGVPAVRLLYGL